MRHGVGESDETLHQLSSQKHGASGHGGHNLDHLQRHTPQNTLTYTSDSVYIQRKAKKPPEFSTKTSLSLVRLSNTEVNLLTALSQWLLLKGFLKHIPLLQMELQQNNNVIYPKYGLF